MRLLTTAILVTGALRAMVPASAQMYDPRYPVCMHVYGEKIGGAHGLHLHLARAMCSYS